MKRPAAWRATATKPGAAPGSVTVRVTVLRGIAGLSESSEPPKRVAETEARVFTPATARRARWSVVSWYSPRPHAGSVSEKRKETPAARPASSERGEKAIDAGARGVAVRAPVPSKTRGEGEGKACVMCMLPLAPLWALTSAGREAGRRRRRGGARCRRRRPDLRGASRGGHIGRRRHRLRQRRRGRHGGALRLRVGGALARRGSL